MADATQGQNTKINLTFSAALVRLIKGDKIARKGWDKGTHLDLTGTNDDNKSIHFVEPNADRIVYVPNQADLLASDWLVLDETDVPVKKEKE